jgi:hypothetical protein
MKAKKFFLWLGVSFVLFVCLIGSCLLAAFSLSEAGREITGDAWRNAGNIGRDYEETLVVNETYELSFDEDGTVHFYGGGMSIALPRGYKVRTPEGRPEDARPYQYFLESPDGRTQVRLRRETETPGVMFWYGADREMFLAHAQAYAMTLAGEAAAEATPVAFVGSSTLEASFSDIGIEGCYRYAGDERAKEGYDGEYFLLLGRGYNNVVLLSVAFKPFDRAAALQKGREFAADLVFS